MFEVNYKVIISPAKNLKSQSSRFIENTSFPFFQNKAKTLVSVLKKLNSKELGELMSISPQLAFENVSRFSNWKKSFGSANEIAAIQLFDGEVFRSFDFNTIKVENFERLNDRIRILSGLYGVLKPFDLIYPYRLEMGTKMEIGTKYRNLYEFWSDDLVNYFEEFVGDSTLINLASNEYSKVLKLNSSKLKVITPVFKEFKNGAYKTVMMYSKNARGKMARYLVENKLNSMDELKNYNIDNYRYHESLSNSDIWVFTR